MTFRELYSAKEYTQVDSEPYADSLLENYRALWKNTGRTPTSVSGDGQGWRKKTLREVDWSE